LRKTFNNKPDGSLFIKGGNDNRNHRSGAIENANLTGITDGFFY